MTTKEMIEVLQAYERGEKIEYRSSGYAKIAEFMPGVSVCRRKTRRFKLTEDILKVAAVIISAVAVLAAIIIPLDYIGCQAFSNGTGMNVRWALGCYVETEDGWVPQQYVFVESKEYRVKVQK